MYTAHKTKVVLLFGGRSSEHEVSLLSAASIFQNLDRHRFEVIPVGIDRAGKWFLQDAIEFKEGASEVWLSHSELIEVGGLRRWPIDVIFPALHGTFCEDGTLQGVLELAQVPYVGSGVLGSSVGMDKDVAKRLVRDAGLPVVPFVTLSSFGWRVQQRKWIQEIERHFLFPLFVKPANLGSSVGIHKVNECSHLSAAIDDAFRFDRKVLVEKGISAREIELSILEGREGAREPRVSVAGEIIPKHEFYSYEAKYLDENGAELCIPALLSSEQMNEAKRLGRKIFKALDCESMARVDLFLEKETGNFYFNEVNTLPGFTKISMYPKLWEASGLSYHDLLSELIDLALNRFQEQSVLVREFEKR